MAGVWVPCFPRSSDPCREEHTVPTPPTFPIPTLSVRAWTDVVIDEVGHDVRSAYVERFWLSILGPSTITL